MYDVHDSLYDVYVSLDDASYGKPVPGAESHYEFCCYFPQNVRTLCALES